MTSLQSSQRITSDFICREKTSRRQATSANFNWNTAEVSGIRMQHEISHSNFSMREYFMHSLLKFCIELFKKENSEIRNETKWSSVKENERREKKISEVSSPNDASECHCVTLSASSICMFHHWQSSQWWCRCRSENTEIVSVAIDQFHLQFVHSYSFREWENDKDDNLFSCFFPSNVSCPFWQERIEEEEQEDDWGDKQTLFFSLFYWQ